MVAKRAVPEAVFGLITSEAAGLAGSFGMEPVAVGVELRFDEVGVPRGKIKMGARVGVVEATGDLPGF